MARKTPKLSRDQAAKATASAHKTRRFLARVRSEDAQLGNKYQAWLQETVAALYLNSWQWENAPWGIDAFVRLEIVQALARPPASGRRIYKAQLFIAFGPHKGSALWKATEPLHAARSDPATFRDILLAHGIYKAAERFLLVNKPETRDDEDSLNEVEGKDGDMNPEQNDHLEKTKVNQDGAKKACEESKNNESSLSGSEPPNFAKRAGPPKRPPSVGNTAQLELFINRDRVEAGDVILVTVREILDQDHDFQSLSVFWEHNF